MRPTRVSIGPWTALKATAALISTCAALVSLLGYVQSWGLVPGLHLPRRLAFERQASWVGLAPGGDTLRAIGDSLHLAASATDRNGALIPGLPTVWASDNDQVATVDEAGTVIAAGAGSATITVTLGGRAAHSRVVVLPRVVSAQIEPDTALTLPEGTRLRLRAVGLDANGNFLRDRAALWASSDSAVAGIDADGEVTASRAGSSTIMATVEGVSAHLGVTVLPVPAAISLLGGGAQRAVVGRRLTEPILVQILSRGGRPVPDAEVRFEVPDGAGALEPVVDTADAQGRASARWTLGSQPGRQRTTVSVKGLDSSVVIVAEAEPVAANTRVALVSEGLEGRVGESIGQPVSVRVTDSLGAALADLPIKWTALDGGTVQAEEARTDSAGEAHALWTLGPKAGPQRAKVQVSDARRIPALTLRATAQPGPAAKLAFIAPARSGIAGRNLGPVRVEAIDAHGNPVPGQSVVFSVHTGSVEAAEVRTDERGAARTLWTLGPAPGDQVLTATASGTDLQASLTVAAAVARPSSVKKPKAKP